MNEKYYIRTLSAEGEAYAIIQLTDEECAAVNKFLSAPEIIVWGNPDFCGDCYISPPFDTFDQARRCINAWIKPEDTPQTTFEDILNKLDETELDDMHV